MPVTHRPAGTPQGGQFAPAGAGGASGAAPKKKKKPTKQEQADKVNAILAGLASSGSLAGSKPAAAGGSVKTPFGDIPEQSVRWRNTATKEQKAALRGYTANKNNEVINEGMRKGGIEAVPESHRSMAQHLSDSFQNAPKFPEPVTVYRGVSLPDAEARQLANSFESAATSGGTVRIKGFTSTSLDPRVAEAFTETTGTDKPGLVLKVRANRGLYLEGTTQWEGEHEMLLNHNSLFKVRGVKLETVGQERHFVAELEQVE